MKALTVLQPWAELIASGAKRIENRSWRTAYRGPLAIHAGRSTLMYAVDAELWAEHYGLRLPLPEEVVFGAVIGVVELKDCVDRAGLESCYPELAGSAFAEGPWMWILENARRIEPVKCRGKLQLWDVHIEIPR